MRKTEVDTEWNPLLILRWFYLAMMRLGSASE